MSEADNTEKLVPGVAESADDGPTLEQLKVGQGVKEAQAAVEELPDNHTGAIPFSDTIEIYPNRRLPQYDTGPVKAYEAIGTEKQAGSYFALVCEPALVPRVNAASIYSTLTNSALVRLITAGVVNWLPAEQQRFVFIYDNSLGTPLLKPGQRQALGWKQEIVMEKVINPFVALLRDFRDRDFVHGSIRLSNLYTSGSGTAEKIMIGECLALPPSFAQPNVYEPIDRAMADPIARGLGSRSDDMYSFGVTLAALLRHNDPLEGMTDKEILRHKIELGSYSATMGKDRFTGAILELLRGLLSDDPSQRWTIDEVESWMDGHRLTPKQAVKKPKAARPITFNGKRYILASLLAMDMEDNVPEIAQLVADGTLGQWLERSLEIKDADELIAKAIKSAEELGQGPGYRQRLACRLSILLDSDAPIRLKGVHMRPEGVGSALAEAFLAKKDLQLFADMIADQTVLYWLDAKRGSGVDSGAIVSKFETGRAYVRLKNMGHGIERCLYILNPECPCLSDKLRGYYVRTPEDLMHAFEDMCANGNAPARFMDRHVVAFLSVKDRRMVDQYLVEINSAERHEQVLGDLKTLATIQVRSRMGKFPAIARALTGVMDPVYQRFHDRELRMQVKQKIEKLKDSGDLSKIANLVDNEESYKRDFRAFRQAMIEYREISKEKEALGARLQKEGEFGRNTGHQVAALFSGIFAGIIIVLFAVMAFTK